MLSLVLIAQELSPDKLYRFWLQTEHLTRGIFVVALSIFPFDIKVKGWKLDLLLTGARAVGMFLKPQTISALD